MAADAIALWVLHTWLVNNFNMSPRLAIASPTKGCGKTTLLRLLNHIARRAKRVEIEENAQRKPLTQSEVGKKQIRLRVCLGKNWSCAAHRLMPRHRVDHCHGPALPTAENVAIQLHRPRLTTLTGIVFHRSRLQATSRRTPASRTPFSFTLIG
jgi:energy-coupling factor transporter ATP-binding protein EcfA2